MSDKLQDEMAYEEGLREIQKSIRKLREYGIDFSKRAEREKFKKALIAGMERMANDKRLFE